MNEFIEKLIGRLEEEAEQSCVLGDIDVWYDGMESGFLGAIEIVKELAEEYKLFGNSEQVNGGWIPCSERFPDKETKYLVCLENGEVKISEYETFLDRNGYLVHAWKRCLKHKVIAWQPLPDPYIEK